MINNAALITQKKKKKIIKERRTEQGNRDVNEGETAATATEKTHTHIAHTLSTLHICKKYPAVKLYFGMVLLKQNCSIIYQK